MLKKVAFAAAASAALFSAPAMAGTATTTMGVSATINGTCSVTANPIAFGTVLLTNANTPASGSVSVNCTNGVAYVVGIDNGNFPGIPLGAPAVDTHGRQMDSGGNKLHYNIFTDAGHATEVGNVGAENISGTGTGAAIVTTIFGLMPIQATPPAGAYADTLNVTVTY
jgi:spore coat protein U-like protein